MNESNANSPEWLCLDNSDDECYQPNFRLGMEYQNGIINRFVMVKEETFDVNAETFGDLLKLKLAGEISGIRLLIQEASDTFIEDTISNLLSRICEAVGG